MSRITVNLGPLKKWAAVVKQKTGPVKTVLKKWAIRYRSFVQERFDKYSKGAGDWKPLSPATIRARRKGHGKGKRKGTGNRNVAILRNTGVMYSALDAMGGRPGSLEEETEFGVLVGFGGAASHGSSGKTIAEIAEIHQEGTIQIPSREIIVDPSKRVLVMMASDAEKGVADAYD